MPVESFRPKVIRQLVSGAPRLIAIQFAVIGITFGLAQPFAMGSQSDLLKDMARDALVGPVDQIITGHKISSAELEAWQARKASFERCGLCDGGQPFPADLPRN
jgi:hypothetical protein